MFETLTRRYFVEYIAHSAVCEMLERLQAVETAFRQQNVGSAVLVVDGHTIACISSAVSNANYLKETHARSMQAAEANLVKYAARNRQPGQTRFAYEIQGHTIQVENLDTLSAYVKVLTPPQGVV